MTTPDRAWWPHRAPALSVHDGVVVVRDDLSPGGTKARFLIELFRGAAEVVYAGPCEGGAQTALAAAAIATGKRATIVVAKRRVRHPRTAAAVAMGARIIEVGFGRLSAVQAAARAYAEKSGAFLAPFGLDMPASLETIRRAATSLKLKPDEVWCAAGSGVLARGLALAWPGARRRVVQVGRQLSADDVAGAQIFRASVPFSVAWPHKAPFPADPHYDAKAWTACMAHRGRGMVVFWNVAAPPTA